MQNFWKFAPWLTRLILVPPTFVFAMIALRYMTHPVEAASAVGLSFTSPLGVTILRIGFGAFPLASAIFTLSCLVSARRILTGLSFVATMIATALVVRVGGMLADGTVQQNLALVRAEIFLLVLISLGIFVEFAHRRRTKAIVA